MATFVPRVEPWRARSEALHVRLAIDVVGVAVRRQGGRASSQSIVRRFVDKTDVVE